MPPAEALDCGNSGTTTRLLSGVLAAQRFSSVLTGDASIQRRPMKRVITPLCAMGADIKSISGNDCAPLSIRGKQLYGVHFNSPIASAQVKSAVLLAGLYASGQTTVTEPALSRDHTERMLRAFGAKVSTGSFEGRPAVTHWYDLDLPEAIDLRRRLLPETERNTYLAMSLLDFRWIDTVRAHGRPVLLILEGVLMYFTEAEVRSFFDAICRDLPDGTTILFDMLAYWLVNNAKHHDVVKKADKTVEFKWSVLDTLEMERWNPRIHLVREYYMSDHARGRFPFIFRTLYHIPYFHRRFNQRIVNLELG